MRVTNNMIMSKTLYNLNKNLSRLDKRNTQISTGKRINRPSDDPVGASKALKLRADVSEIHQYQRNSDDAISWLDITESAIDNLEDVLLRAKEITVQASSGTLADEDRDVIASEMEELKQQIMQIGNTTYAGRYIFSGFQTDKEVFDNGTNLYNIDTTTKQTIKYQIGIGEEINVGVFASDLFGAAVTPFDGFAPDETAKIIDDFRKVTDDLQNNNIAGITSFLSKVDQHHTNALSIRSEIGAKINRLELVQNRLEQDNLSFTELLSENENVDMAETIMHLKMEESVYRASLSAGAQVIQPTLLDFIR